ncbi:hypothetical protein C2S53_005093 [Perilla frutescens var. hirtella]|uniref:PGG domain-containing protein n=1 Tax=Perilla frutescens var. hirtella TaxID=608512 RepID=A0AAD4J0P3_PERFH|nr:hypothetical protein C2S53_005093 [Perilla frutescens var. hirtella]
MVEAVTTINICERECSCCIDRIYTNEWKEMDGMKFTETPLHCAAAAGNTAVVLEILSLMPCLGKKLNPEGLSPLHVAIKAGHRDMARTLSLFDSQLVRVKGKGGMTPLMQCAAGAGDDEGRKLLAKFLLSCPQSVADVNNRGQTVVHVALENQQCDAVCVLVDWLTRRDQISSVLNVKDFNGNTVLHAAAQFGCVKGARKLVDLVKLNRLNSNKETAVDVAEEFNQKEVLEVLRNKGARSRSESSPTTTTTEYVLTKPTFFEAISRKYHYLTQELTLDMRSAILVVAALIVTATYQGVLQPPGGVYPPADAPSPAPAPAALLHTRLPRRLVSEIEVPPPHTAGQMVMKENQFRYFIPSNSFAFALSAVIIIFVVPGSPVFLILHLCLVFMCFSYLLALDAISAYTGISNMIYIMASYAIVGAFLVKLFYYPVKALLVDEDWWLRGFGVKVSNCWSKITTKDSKVITVAESMKKQHRVLDLK